MRILLLTQTYPPEPEKILSDLAEGLQDLGHDVTVLTGFPNWPSGKLYPGYRIRLWQRETIHGVPVIRVPLYPDHSTSAVKRTLNMISFVFFATLLGPSLVPRVDIVHVVHPPLLTIGPSIWLYCQVRRIPFTYEIQDMWPETMQATGLMTNRLANTLVGWFAKWVYRRAAAIRVISPGFRSNLINKGVPAEKIHAISNWTDTDFFRPQEHDPELAESLGLAGHFNVMYAGTMGRAQGLETVMEAAWLLKDLSDVQFVLVGDGLQLDRLKHMARDRVLTNVKFLGRYPAEQMPGLFALAHALLVHLRDEPLFRITIPHKTLDYLASSVPVLAAVEGDAADVVTSAQAGLTCPPGDGQAMADTVRQLYALSAAERKTMANNGRSVACERFGRLHLIGQIAEMMQTVIDKHGRRRSNHRVALLKETARA